MLAVGVAVTSGGIRIDCTLIFSVLSILPCTVRRMNTPNSLYTLPGHMIRRVHQISTAMFAAECGRFDLTAVQYAALFTIGENPKGDATRLSDLTALDRSSLGQVLERLETKGWVLRSSSPGDKRVKLLSLSL